MTSIVTFAAAIALCIAGGALFKLLSPAALVVVGLGLLAALIGALLAVDNPAVIGWFRGLWRG